MFSSTPTSRVATRVVEGETLYYIQLEGKKGDWSTACTKEREALAYSVSPVDENVLLRGRSKGRWEFWKEKSEFFEAGRKGKASTIELAYALCFSWYLRLLLKTKAVRVLCVIRVSEASPIENITRMSTRLIRKSTGLEMCYVFFWIHSLDAFPGEGFEQRNHIPFV